MYDFGIILLTFGITTTCFQILNLYIHGYFHILSFFQNSLILCFFPILLHLPDLSFRLPFSVEPAALAFSSPRHHC